MTALLAALVPLAAIIGALLTYRMAKRTDSTTRRGTSGTVATSDAAALWTEGAALRESLANQVSELRKELADASVNIKDLLHEIALSNTATEQAREESRRARQETAALRGEIAQVHDEVKTGNALTIGVLADNAESRRIAAIPQADRTAGENEHLGSLGIKNEEGGRDPS